MKAMFKVFYLATLVSILGFALAGCKEPDTPSGDVITYATIRGVIAPVTGAAPVSMITETDQYKGTVAWSPNPSTFAAWTVYTATITLTAKTGYTLQGVAANFFTVAGAELVSNAANSGVITAVFPSTTISTSVINIAAIQGVTAPANGGTPVTAITENAQYSGTVSWTPAVSEIFASATVYTATITLTAKSGYTLQGVRANFFTAAGATTISNSANSGVITAVFPATSVAISITAPTKGAAPNTIASGAGNFTISAVTWSPGDNPFLGSKVYTATVTLTADSGYTFTGLNSATINGQNATVSNNTGKAVTLSYTFPATLAKAVVSMEIKTQPTKLIYTHGNTLYLAGLEVTLTYDDNTTEDIAAVNFTAKNITANPAQGVNLVHVTHDGQPVTITYGNLPPQTTNNLSVTKTFGTWANITAINTTYKPTLTLSDVTLPTGYAFTAPDTKLYAGNSQSFAATYTNPNGNYETASGNITVNIAKSGPASWPTAAAITYGSLLSTSELSGGDTAAGSFAWTNKTTFPTVTNSGYSVTFTPVDTANYTVTTGTVAITVNKATGEIVSAPTLSRNAHNRILVNALTTATGQNVQYGISTSSGIIPTAWQSERLFTGLNANTTYYIFAYAVESDNYNTGAVSVSLQAMTRSSDVLTVTTTAEWNDALAHIITFGGGTAETPQTYIITVSGNVPVSGSTNNSFGSISNVAVTLKGNGKLYLNSQGRMITVGSNQNLIIDSDGLIMQGIIETVQPGSRHGNYYPLIYSSGILELKNGIISGNSNLDGSGGGVYASIFIMTGGIISGNSSSGGLNNSYGGGVYASTFTMTGGTISDNRNNSSSSNGLGESSSYGGGVYVVNNFTMTGGTISGNSSSRDSNGLGESSSNYGGGVYASTFTMEGGTISGNSTSSDHYSSSYGGGVYVVNNFTMTGGTISDNSTSSGSGSFGSGGTSRSTGGGVYASTFTMEGGIIRGNSNSCGNMGNSMGGGVYVVSNFTMKEGTISGNSNSSGSNSGSYGGGVYASTFTMEGGTISGNINNNITYGSSGGGVYASTFTMEGGIISGNSTSSNSNYYGGLGGGVSITNVLIKTGGIIYGNNASDTDKNTVTGTNAYSYAVYYEPNYDLIYYRDSTLGENDNLYSTAPLPANSGQSLNGWTMR